MPIVATRLESRKSLLGSEPAYQYETRLDFGDNFHQEPFQPQPAYHQAGFSQSSYVDNSGVDPASNQGYAYREGLTASAPAASTRVGKFDFLKNRWVAALMAVCTAQAILCLCFEACVSQIPTLRTYQSLMFVRSYIFWNFQTSLKDGYYNHADQVNSQYKTIPTFLTLFIFGFLALLAVVWDALRMKNTIQIIGVCIANLALLVYSSIQVDQIREALQILEDNNALEDGITAEDVWPDVKPYLAAIPGIIALCTVLMSLTAWKLYQVFAWDILKNIGADYRMKKRFLHYQVILSHLRWCLLALSDTT